MTDAIDSNVNRPELPIRGSEAATRTSQTNRANTQPSVSGSRGMVYDEAKLTETSGKAIALLKKLVDEPEVREDILLAVRKKYKIDLDPRKPAREVVNSFTKEAEKAKQKKQEESEGAINEDALEALARKLLSPID